MGKDKDKDKQRRLPHLPLELWTEIIRHACAFPTSPWYGHVFLPARILPDGRAQFPYLALYEERMSALLVAQAVWRVCRAWRAIVEPILHEWHFVQDEKTLSLLALTLQQPAGIEGKSKGWYVRKLELAVEAAPTGEHQLLAGGGCARELLITALMHSVVRLCPRLERLDVSGYVDDSPEPLWNAIRAGCRESLSYIALPTTFQSAEEFITLLSICPNIRVIRYVEEDMLVPESRPDRPLVLPDTSIPEPALVQHWAEILSKTKLDALGWYLRGCCKTDRFFTRMLCSAAISGLQHLEITLDGQPNLIDVHPFRLHDDLRDLLRVQGPSVRKLELRGVDYLEVNDECRVLDMLALCPNLEDFAFDIITRPLRPPPSRHPSLRRIIYRTFFMSPTPDLTRFMVAEHMAVVASMVQRFLSPSYPKLEVIRFSEIRPSHPSAEVKELEEIYGSTESVGVYRAKAGRIRQECKARNVRFEDCTGAEVCPTDFTRATWFTNDL